MYRIAAFAESLTRLLVGIFWTKVKHIKRALAFSIILSIAYIIIGGGMQTEEFYGFVFSMVACFLTGCSSGLGCVTSYGKLYIYIYIYRISEGIPRRDGGGLCSWARILGDLCTYLIRYLHNY